MRKDVIGISAFLCVMAGAAMADSASVVTSCSAGDDCVASVNAEIASMQGSSAEKDKAIADLVVVLGQQSQTASRQACEQMAAGVRASATSVSDAGQQTRIMQIADSMCTQQVVTATVNENGDDDGGEPGEAPSASPN